MREEGDTPYTSRDSGTRALRVPGDTTPRSESHTQPVLTREQRHRLLRRESLRGSSYPKDASLASEADSQTWRLGSRGPGGGGAGSGEGIHCVPGGLGFLTPHRVPERDPRTHTTRAQRRLSRTRQLEDKPRDAFSR